MLIFVIMLRFFSVILFVISGSIFSQSLNEELKADSLDYSSTGKTAIVYKGKKTGIYDVVQDKFLVNPVKSKIFYFAGHPDDSKEFFAVFGKKESYIFLVNDDSSTVEFPLKKPVEISFCASAHLDYCKNDLSYNGMEFDIKNWEETDKVGIEWTEKIGVEFIDDEVVLLENFRTDHHFFNSSNDRLDISDTAIMTSGVLDIETNRWLVPPVYAEIIKLNDYLICRKLKSTHFYEQYLEHEYSFDLYKIGDNDFELVNSDFTALDEECLAAVYNIDKVIALDNGNYITIKEGKYGVRIFRLNWFYSLEETLIYFDYGEWISDDYDFIYYFSKYGAILAFNAEKKTISIFNSNDAPIRPDEYGNYGPVNPVFIADHNIEFSKDILQDPYAFSNEKVYKVEYFDGNFNQFNEIMDEEVGYADSEDNRYGFYFLNDSLVYFQCFNRDIQQFNALESIEFPGEDSIDFEGQVVYPPDIPGFDKSGILNLNSGEWEIEPRYRECQLLKKGFLLTETIRDPVMNLDKGQKLSLKDYEGNVIFESLSADSVNANLGLLKYIISQYEVDSLFRSPSGYFSHNQIWWNRIYYFRSGNKLGLYEPEGNYFVNTSTYRNMSVKDFIHCNPDLEYCFYIENDSLYLEIDTIKLAVKAEKCKIDLKIGESTFYPSGQSTAFQLCIQNDNDTIIEINTVEPYMKDQTNNVIENRIYYSQDKLIINENHKGIKYMELVGGDILTTCTIERENSSVWEKNNGAWVKVTPYYAKVDPNPLGYVVKTGDFQWIDPILGSSRYEIASYDTTETIGRYLLLDSNYNAVNFMDWYDFPYMEDLGFGIKVCQDSACFFVDYSGKPLTDSEWHEFQLENGKLKAIRYDNYNIKDPKGASTDEFMMGIVPELVKVEYFELK